MIVCAYSSDFGSGGAGACATAEIDAISNRTSAKDVFM